MKILEILKDNQDKFSSARLFMLLVCITTITDWQHAIWTVGTWTPEWQTIGMVLGVLGFKVMQKKAE